MASTTFSRNNLLAGLFVIFSLLLAVFISVLVSGVQKRLIPVNDFTVRFSLPDGASGLKPGSIVTVGGKEAGRVNSVEFDRDSPDAMPTGVKVQISVYRSVTLYDDAVAFLERPLLGTVGTLNILRGVPEAAPGKTLAGGSIIRGMIAPPAFLAQAGYGTDQSRQLQNVLARADSASEKFDRILTTFDRDFEPMVKSLRAATDDAAEVTRRVREKAPEWTEQIDKFLARAQSAAEQADQAIRDVRAAIDTNRPAIDKAIANVEKITEDIKTTSVPMLNETLASGKSGAEEFRVAMKDVRELLQEQEPNLRRALANFRLASDQFKLLGVEVRRSPWRLLYQPGTKELDSELFYDAARTYAEAVSDLRAASEALESVQGGNSTPQARDRQTLSDLSARLNEAFTRYNDAEKTLLKRMTEQKP